MKKVYRVGGKKSAVLKAVSEKILHFQYFRFPNVTFPSTPQLFFIFFGT
jgi:hypothetical protein